LWYNIIHYTGGEIKAKADLTTFENKESFLRNS